MLLATFASADKCAENADCDSSATCSLDAAMDLGYKCFCNAGYIGTNNSTIVAGGTKCGDYDECANDADDCGGHAGACVNTVGSYSCLTRKQAKRTAKALRKQKRASKKAARKTARKNKVFG